MTDQMNMNRRKFLEQVTAWSAGAALTAPVFRVSAAQEAAGGVAEGAQSVVAVAEGKDYGQLVNNVLKPLGGIEAFVKKGDRVVVKPNMAWDRTPDQAANAHPEIVKAMVKLALDAGAKEVKVFDRTCNEERKCYANSGIKDAVESIDDKRVSCPYIDKRKWMPVKIEKGKALKEWELYADAIKADCYINIPILKQHGATRLSMGLKNVMGVMGGNRGKVHKELAQSIADLNLVIAPKLTVIDATRILLRNGPQGGDLDDVKVMDTLIASADIVAADAYGAKLFGMKPEDVPPTVAAYEMGMGEMDLDKIKILKV